MARLRQWSILAALGLAVAGCVPQEKYTALKMDDEQVREQLGNSERDTQQAQAEAAAYKSQLASLSSSGNNHDALLNNLQAQNSTLQSELDEMNRKYADAMGQVGRAGVGTALPAPLSNALSDFAAQNPDLIEFDAARGVVKFKSDVTFAPGDATVTPKAKDVLGRFATILDSSAAEHYELLVAGHTDNVPVANPETKRRGHLDNWYLSAHRAIAVSEQLIAAGVSAHRLGAVGYADERPIASNLTDAGKAQNRRVEVLILPTMATHTQFNDGGGTVHHHKTATVTPPPMPMMNKDSGAASLNK